MLNTNEVILNAIQSRTAFFNSLTGSTRDIEKECQHPIDILTEDYALAFERGDLAARVVNLYPEECWSSDPDIYETEGETETEFEKEWKALDKQFQLLSMLQRVDVLSGIGRFGIILLGIDDGLPLKQPVGNIDEKGNVTGANKYKLIYLRAFSESYVRVGNLETDVQNPRFGLPRDYQITFVDTSTPQLPNVKSTVSQDVHWTRVIHIADNRTNSDIYGLPRMKKVFNRLLDLKKILGGSGEMFWKGGFPGLSLEATPTDENIEIDQDATKEQIEAYQNGLQRYLATTGLTVKSLAPQVADPTQHIEGQIRLIAMAMSVPWRILMGVEVGQLASEQDIRKFNRILCRRQNRYLTPYVITPFIDRLIALGILPAVSEKNGYCVDWPDLNSPSDTDKAAIAEKRTNAIAKYVQAGADMLVPPFHFLTLVLDFTDEEADSIINAASATDGSSAFIDPAGDSNNNQAIP